jgi:hypothetical protein
MEEQSLLTIQQVVSTYDITRLCVLEKQLPRNQNQNQNARSLLRNMVFMSSVIGQTTTLLTQRNLRSLLKHHVSL